MNKATGKIKQELKIYTHTYIYLVSENINSKLDCTITALELIPEWGSRNNP